MLAAPDTRAIDVTLDGQGKQADVRGRAGAVPAKAWVLVGNIEMNDFVQVRSDITGGFAAKVAAAPGTHVMIKQDITGRIIRPPEDRHQFDEDMIAPGVLIRLPHEPTAEGVAFAAGARLCCEDQVGWLIEGRAETDVARAGHTIQVSGEVSLLSDPVRRPPRANIELSMALLADDTGRQVGRAGKFVTPYLTATGLPIERTVGDIPSGRRTLNWLDLSDWRLVRDRWVASFAGELRVPQDAPDGVYSLLAGGMWELSDAGLEPTSTRRFDVVVRDSQARLATLGTLVLGDPRPTRLATVLLADDASEGSRGVTAREDEGLFDVHLRTLTRHSPVLPRLDHFGEPWAYRLEPYAVMLDAVDRALPNSPSLPLDLDDSALQITITRPDGQVDVLGPARIARYGVKSPRTEWGATLGAGGGELRELPQLLGDGDTFAYQFPQDGEYVVEAHGFVRGVDGRRYDICGTYDVTVANVLDIEPGLLPTTPFEIGDAIAPTLTAWPGMPVDVTYDVTHAAADGTVSRENFTGRSNRFGYWDGDGATFTFVRDGEYRIDIYARGTDSSGKLWAGRMTFGSVIASPNPPLVAHGRRGSDGLREIPPPWLFVRDLNYTNDASAPHMHFPYFSGDILWGQNHPNDGERFAGEAVVLHSAVQVLDQDDPLVSRAIQIYERFDYWDGPEQTDVLRIGQMPLRLAPEEPGRDNFTGAHPDDLSLWAYSYRSAERPGVRVREGILGDDVSGSYWRFGDGYGGQFGNGPFGDEPDDIKFMYGAAVIRDPAAGLGTYAIYGSAWVHARDDDPLGARIMPPYRGAAGGPDGGPLLNVHGRDFEILFMPLGVRSGSVLEVGDRFVLSGAVMPTLASRVDYQVTAPDGTVRSLGGRANAIGFYYDPSDDFVVDQQGIWTVSLEVTHDGGSSAGPVEPPFPTGGPLTPDGSTFSFVVVDEATRVLSVKTDLTQYGPNDWWEWGLVREADFSAALPPDMVVTNARIIVSIPGITMVDGEPAQAGGELRWHLDAEDMRKLADNFDVEPNIADTINVTLSRKARWAAAKPSPSAPS